MLTAMPPSAHTQHLLLDTHVWIWLVTGQPGMLAPPVLAAIDAAGARRELLVSIVSVWKIGLLHARQRINLSMPIQTWVQQALSPPGIRLLPLSDPAVLLDSCALPGEFHPDPADRMLVAAARAEGATLVTRDRKILDYAQLGHVRALAA